MRDIKFRGKRIDNGEWTTGDLIQLLGKQGGGRKFIVDNRFGACIDADGNFVNTEAPFVNEVYPETVGQYTELKDKNGNEIYEGDIVRWHDIVTSDYAITFSDGVFCLDGRSNENFYHHRCELRDKWEVIGNIHSHPHLLGGNQT